MERKCPVCGAPMEGEGCGYCGYKQITPQQTASQQVGVQPQIIINNTQMVNNTYAYGISSKSKTVAILLCLFFGGIGIHRFYVGKIGSGILYLFTGGLFGIGWLVDLIKIILGSFTDSHGLPLKN